MSKILLISHIFPPAIDGGSRVIYKIGQYFQSCGDEILYLSSNCSSTDDFTKKTKTPCPVKGRVGEGFRLPVYHSLRRPLRLLEIIFKNFLFINHESYILNLIKISQKGPIFKLFPFLKATIQILKFKPDLIIAGPLPTTIILYANFFKKITSISKSINRFHSFLQRRGLRGRFCPKLLINASFHQTDSDFHQIPLIKTLQSADYLWTLTQFETDYFIKNFHINPAKIILAGNGVDESFLKKTTPCPIKVHRYPEEGRRVAEGFNILFIGSFAAHKGLDILIESFSNICHLKSNISLTIAGQPTLYYPLIKNQILKLPKNVRSRIKLIFSFSQNQLSKIIDSCDILVLPSKQESFGLVLIEAWARKKPVIVSDIPSLSELITQSQGGLIFKLDDPLDLKQKILNLVKNSDLRYQLKQNGFNYVKNNYTWTIIGRKIQKKLSL